MKIFCLKRVLLIILFSMISLNANEYKATLAQMPIYAESADKGVLIDLVKEISTVSNNQIDIKVLPFASSVNLVVFKKRDFHLPLIKNDIVDESKLPYLYSTDTIFHVNFVIYSLKDKNVNLDNLSTLKVETDRAHVSFFPFEVKASNSIEKSLEDVKNGKIDAFVFADFATDPFLKNMDNKAFKRELYKRFDVKIILPKSDKAKEIDTMLSDSIAKLRANGKYSQIIGPVDAAYDNWQP